ncbi:MAG TPA: hypothetical protein DCM26_00170, partial [Desulfotomaculum sp.]|nr:hypothetical protein [Desulfotomaculum sp.]
TYWEDDTFRQEIKDKGKKTRNYLEKIVQDYPEIQGEVRGRGLMQGIACGVAGLAEKICAAAFKHGLIIETSGPDSEVVKLMPPLVIDEAGLDQGFRILETSIQEQGIRTVEWKDWNIEYGPKKKNRPADCGVPAIA